MERKNIEEENVTAWGPCRLEKHEGGGRMLVLLELEQPQRRKSWRAFYIDEY